MEGKLMSELMRVKDWLVQQGHMTEVTRGKLSKENEAIARTALSEAWCSMDGQ